MPIIPGELGEIGQRLRDQLMRKLRNASQCKAAQEAINTCRLLASPEARDTLWHLELACFKRIDELKRMKAAGVRP